MGPPRSLRRLKRKLSPAVLYLYAWVGWAAFPPPAPAEPALEYQVKAAFLLNFTRFIEWPPNAFANPAAPFSICVLGKDPFGRALDDLVEGETVGERRLTVQRISHPPETGACQLVFVGAGDGDGGDFSKLPNRVSPGVLTVGEGTAFLRDGGMIAFVIDHRRVRFDINLPAADAAALKVSSKLLRVARSVEK